MRIAVALAAIAALVAAATADASATSRLNPCKLLTAKQVAAVHVDTSCKIAIGRPNPYYTGVSGTWGKLGGKGSVIVGIDKAKSHDYIALVEKNTPGKSFGVGSWSRGACATTGVYCAINFVVGNYVVAFQVAPPRGKPLTSAKQAIAMAKVIAAELS
jgi:hypothetical protein